jgi:hypothetical protein
MLEVRFLPQPLENYRVIGVIDQQNNIIRGYMVVGYRRGHVIVLHCRTAPRMFSKAAAIVTLCRNGTSHGETFGMITLRGSMLASVLERYGFITLPAKFGESENSLLGFWRLDHPLGRYFERHVAGMYSRVSAMSKWPYGSFFLGQVWLSQPILTL